MNRALDRIESGSAEAFKFQPRFDVADFVADFAATYGGVTRSRFQARATLFAQGDPADHLYYIEAGRIRVSVVSAQGKAAVLDVLEPGNFCGESCLVGDPFRTATAAAVSDCAVVRLDRLCVIRAFQQDAKFAEFLFAYVLNSRARLIENLTSQLLDCGEMRLARVLLVLANGRRDGRRESIITNLGQEALSQMVGTTRTRVNQFMNKFRRLGYIDYADSSVTVHGSLRNWVRRQDECEEQAVASLRTG
jgi:CRP-like cAMP-binding protein